MAHLNERILSDEEAGELDGVAFADLFTKVRPRGYISPERCSCGRFARHIRYEANTMPHGEAVITVQCSRCGEVKIR